VKRIVCALALAAVGCGGGSYPPGYMAPTDNIERNYTIGVEVRATVGSPFIRYERKRVHWYHTNMGAWFAERQSEAHELLYSGTDGKTLLVAYREYSAQDESAAGGDFFARPAYAQDLRYDLSASDVIVFRAYRIRVVEATNEAIRVVVLSDGGESPSLEPGAP
jgi:hypothetical protein